MKRKKKPDSATESVETYGGGYHYFESTFVLPAKYRDGGKPPPKKRPGRSKPPDRDGK